MGSIAVSTTVGTEFRARGESLRTIYTKDYINLRLTHKAKLRFVACMPVGILLSGPYLCRI
jgi:hypothetical protein